MAKQTLVTNGAAIIKVAEKESVILSWHDIEVDPRFNARHGLETGSLEGKKAEDAESNFIGLCILIARDGQKVPVVVRPNPAYGKEKDRKPYILVSGFQRRAAIGVIAMQAGGEELVKEVNDALCKAMGTATRNNLLTDKPTIMAFIRPMTEVEARFENLAENMVRNKLSVPDICYQVSEIVKLDPSLSDDAIAQRLSRSQAYVRDLRAIFQGLQKTKAKVQAPGHTKAIPVLEAWRDCTVPVPYKDMLDIASLETSDEQAKAFTDKAYDKKGSGNGLERGKHSWANNAGVYAGQVAGLLGKLAKEGVIDVDTERLFTAEVMPHLVHLMSKPSKTERNEDEWAQVAGAAETAFNEALKAKAPKAAKSSGKLPPAPKSSGKLPQGKGKGARA